MQTVICLRAKKISPGVSFLAPIFTISVLKISRYKVNAMAYMNDKLMTTKYSFPRYTVKKIGTPQ